MRLERISVEQVLSPTTTKRPCSMLLTLLAVCSSPLPELGVLDRMLLRCMAIAGLARVRSLSGLEHIAADRDPFILALNHNSRQEALLVPALLFLLRVADEYIFSLTGTSD
jgi:hypothetical protein